MKIGIITMHGVLNYGSALQAYALQKKISDLGYECEIIDYKYPSRREQRVTIKSIINNVFVYLRAFMMGFPRQKRKKRFQEFYNLHFKLSVQKYDINNISENPPLYDIYMTGSDQVWNPRNMGMDTNFLLSFVPNSKPKLSYASSFATATLPDSHKELYKKYLLDYTRISVREPSGVQLVKELIGKDASVCCDPVFLLSRNQWSKVANDAIVKNRGKYILVYALYYMFDPYPELLTIIDHVQKTLGYKVLYLNGRKEDAFRPNSTVLKAEGPLEFIRLIQDAEIVITSSFHGTAFSLIYEKPLMAIIRQGDSSDSRISSLLQSIGCDNNIIPYNSRCTFTKEELYQLKPKSSLQRYVNKSASYLENVLFETSKSKRVEY